MKATKTSKNGTKYQLFQPLSEEQYSALKADIAANGCMVPVEKDVHGNVLDGHNRKAICEELGIEYPEVVRDFKSEEDKKTHVLMLNMARRQLTPEQWAEAFEKLLKVRGVKLGRGSRNDKGGTSVTFPEVA